VHLTEPLDIPGSSVFVKRSKPRGVRVVSYPKILRSGLSQPRWVSESPRVSTRDRRSCLTFVSDHQPPNVVGKTLMIPRFIGGYSEFLTLMVVSGLAASYSSGLRMSVSGALGCAELPGGVAKLTVFADLPRVEGRCRRQVRLTTVSAFD
jgi:hypothetical protein